MKINIFFGPPGTGKTTALLDEMDLFLAGGTTPQRIGFFSFSRRAVAEAKARVTEKFGIDPESMPWFRTIHSAAYRLLGLARGEVVQNEHLLEFAKVVDLPLTPTISDELAEKIFEPSLGDRCLGLYGLAKARGTDLLTQYHEAGVPGTPLNAALHTAEYYEEFKTVNGLWDFSDMIEKAQGSLPLDVLFVDEAQDCSPAQWMFLRRVARDVPVIYIAGDDDQTIFRWAGADSTMLLKLKGECSVLPFSYRLPSRIKHIADHVIGSVVQRVPKEFAARGEEGTVDWITSPNTLDMHDKKSWLLLARSNFQLRSLRRAARAQGVVYNLPGGGWSHSLSCVRAAIAFERVRKGNPISHSQALRIRAFMRTKFDVPDREELLWDDLFSGENNSRPWFDSLNAMSPTDVSYIRALRSSGESLSQPGRVRISTVHGAKGAEADNVVLVTDVSRRVWKGSARDPEAEKRVQYVAVTRAKSSIYLLLPRSHCRWTFSYVGHGR